MGVSPFGGVDVRLPPIDPLPAVRYAFWAGAAACQVLEPDALRLEGGVRLRLLLG